MDCATNSDGTTVNLNINNSSVSEEERNIEGYQHNIPERVISENVETKCEQSHMSVASNLNDDCDEIEIME